MFLKPIISLKCTLENHDFITLITIKHGQILNILKLLFLSTLCVLIMINFLK